MGKICYINGQPYMVSVPTGGKSEDDKNNQWDELINFLGADCNHIFHWERMCSWCQEKVSMPYQGCVIRGGDSARYWYSTISSRYMNVGLRPVLVPLDPDTLNPDPSLLADIPDGRVFALASLYMGKKVIKSSVSLPGEIPNYILGEEIILGDRDANPENWIYVIKYKDLLWTDRNILKMISWDDLKQQGFVD